MTGILIDSCIQVGHDNYEKADPSQKKKKKNQDFINGFAEVSGTGEMLDS